MKCPKCNKEVDAIDVNYQTEELWCKHCKQWHFYGMLLSELSNGGTMRPDNVTEQLKREYDGKTDFHL